VKANKAKFDNMQKALEDYNSEEASLKERLSAVDKELASLKVRSSWPRVVIAASCTP
jgi:K+/H+ antiporter YhaU regulatory subunit KhtT